MTGTQLQQARLLVGWSRREMAVLCGFSEGVVWRFERFGQLQQPMFARTAPIDRLAKMRALLEAAGVEFIDADVGGPGVRMRVPAHKSEAGTLMSLRTSMPLPSIDQAIAAATASRIKWLRLAERLAAARHTQLQGGGVWNRDAKSLQRAQEMAAHYGAELQLLAGARVAWLNGEP